MQTIMTGSGLYEELAELDRLLTEYEETKIKDPGRAHALEHLIINELSKSQLDKEIQVKLKGEKKSLSELNPEELHSLPFEDLAREIHGRLSTIRNTQIQDGMHIFGSLPEGERRVDFIYSILRYDAGEEISLRREVAKLMGYDLAELLRDTSRVDEKTGKSYGAILEEIDMVSKDAIRQVLSEAGFLKQEDDHEAGSRNTVE